VGLLGGLCSAFFAASAGLMPAGIIGWRGFGRQAGQGMFAEAKSWDNACHPRQKVLR
jgi:hypothetical protein